MTAGFDTIGRGAKTHTVIMPEPEPQQEPKKEEERSYLWIFIIIGAIICIAIIGTVVLFIMIKKGKAKEEKAVEASPVYDVDTASPQAPIDTGIPLQDVTGTGIPLQDVIGTGIPQQYVDNTTTPMGSDHLHTEAPPIESEYPVETWIPPVEEVGVPAQIEHPTEPQVETEMVDEAVYQGELEGAPSDPTTSTIQQAPIEEDINISEEII